MEKLNGLPKNMLRKNLKTIVLAESLVHQIKINEKNYLIPDLKEKIKRSKKKIILKNLNHYRDFVSMEDIAKVINLLLKQRFKGTVNICSGRGIYLKDIAKIILKKYKNKNYEFIDNNIQTSLIGNNKKLKKMINFEIYKSIERLIF